MKLARVSKRVERGRQVEAGVVGKTAQRGGGDVGRALDGKKASASARFSVETPAPSASVA